jgi:hypothetical protein
VYEHKSTIATISTYRSKIHTFDFGFCFVSWKYLSSRYNRNRRTTIIQLVSIATRETHSLQRRIESCLRLSSKLWQLGVAQRTDLKLAQTLVRQFAVVSLEHQRAISACAARSHFTGKARAR